MKLSMGTAMKTAMIAAGLATLPTVANAATAMLAATDYVGISFWTISMAMMAAAIFFLMEAGRLPGKWKTAMTIWCTRADRCSGTLFLHARRMGQHW